MAYIAGLSILYAGLLFGCTRFLRAWFQLRGILHLLELHPLRDAFRRIPKDLANLSFWSWGGKRPRFLTLGQSIHHLRLLTSDSEQGGYCAGELDYAGLLKSVEENTQAWMAADASGRRPKELVVHTIHAALLEAT